MNVSHCPVCVSVCQCVCVCVCVCAQLPNITWLYVTMPQQQQHTVLSILSLGVQRESVMVCLCWLIYRQGPRTNPVYRIIKVIPVAAAASAVVNLCRHLWRWHHDALRHQPGRLAWLFLRYKCRGCTLRLLAIVIYTNYTITIVI